MPRVKWRNLKGQASETITSVQDVCKELADGVTITLIRKPNAKLLDFIFGKTLEFPFSIKVDISEEEADE